MKKDIKNNQGGFTTYLKKIKTRRKKSSVKTRFDRILEKAKKDGRLDCRSL